MVREPLERLLSAYLDKCAAPVAPLRYPCARPTHGRHYVDPVPHLVAPLRTPTTRTPPRCRLSRTDVYIHHFCALHRHSPLALWPSLPPIILARLRSLSAPC